VEEETEIQKQARREQEKEDNERAEKEQIEVEGLEGVIAQHGFTRAWTELLVGCTDLMEQRVSSVPKSKAGEALLKRIKSFRRLLRGKASEEAGTDPEITTQDHIKLITRDVRGLTKSAGSDREFSSRATDLHGHILPWLGKTVKVYLRANQADGRLPSEAAGNLQSLLDVSWEAADMLCRWGSRPTSLNGKMRLVQTVRRHLNVLREAYGKIAAEFQRIARDQRARERAAEASQRSVSARGFADIEEKRARLEAIREEMRSFRPSQPAPRSMPPPPPRREPTSPRLRPLIVPPELDRPQGISREAYLFEYHQQGDSRLQQKAIRDRFVAVTGRAPRGILSLQQENEEVFDIDDYDEAPASSSARPVPVRPQFNRAPTEEIPAPSFLLWSAAETKFLIKALQQDLSDDRFQNILDAYGGEGNVLHRHDLDSMMAQARFIKQSMGNKLAEANFDDRWLRLVRDN
jgi:hypothetical protein